jgi:hypothetical protein
MPRHQEPPPVPTDIAFLAIAEAQQLYHGLPAALELARRPDVRVSILSPSDQILAMIASYDPHATLNLIRLRRPSLRPDSLFRQPSRLATLLLNYRTIARFPTHPHQTWRRRSGGRLQETPRRFRPDAGRGRKGSPPHDRPGSLHG